VTVAGRELGPGVADADDGAAIEEIVGIALILHPTAMHEAIAIGLAEPRLAAQTRLFLRIHDSRPALLRPDPTGILICE
jgi:hypothetical protein